MLTSLLLTCVLSLAAQDAPQGVPPSFVIGLSSDDNAPDATDPEGKEEQSKEEQSKEEQSKEEQSKEEQSKEQEGPAKAAPQNRINSSYGDDVGEDKKKNASPVEGVTDPYAPWGETKKTEATPAGDDVKSGKKGERKSGYTPLPEGKVLPPMDPPPRPPPVVDDKDRPPVQGVATPQFPGVLVFPLQVISGIIAGIAMVPVTALTLGLALPLAPAAIALAEVSIGDLVGQNRGTLFWPTVGAYCTSASCSSLYGAGAFVLIALVTTQVITFAAISPALLISAALIAPLVFLPAFAAANIFATALAPAIIYPYASEKKRSDDPDLHFPGFFSPNHRTPRQPPGTPQAAMVMAY